MLAVYLSILYWLGVLLLNTPYSQQYVDQQIHIHQQEIEAVRNDEQKMSQVTMYTYKRDQAGYIVIIEEDGVE